MILVGVWGDQMRISEKMFGGHLLVHKDVTDAGGPVERFTQFMNLSSLRYPGGTITERIAQEGRFDEIFGSPGPAGSPSRLVTLAEAQQFAFENGTPLQFVIPTHAFFTGATPGNRAINYTAIDSLMDKLALVAQGHYGPYMIEHFEIGNEYWGKGEFELTATEYGRIANYMIKKLADIVAIREAADDQGFSFLPKIAVQSGVGWVAGSNPNILAQLDMEARSHIDSVVTHFYPGSLENVPQRSLLFDLMHQFASAEGMRQPDLIVTEWNIHAAVSGDRGLKQASAIIEAFNYMVLRGVTTANVWGTNYKHLDTKLARMSHNPADGTPQDEITLTYSPSGVIYRVMSRELPGAHFTGKTFSELQVIEGDAQSLEINTYDSIDKRTVFIASRSNDATKLYLKLDQIFAGAEHVYVQVISAIDDPRTNINEADPQSASALPGITSRTFTLGTDGAHIELNPFEIAFVSILKNPEIGLFLEGDFQDISDDFSYDDELEGSTGHDWIQGYHGNDRIFGIAGKNILDGGSGNDSIFGGSGSDLIFSGSGTDVIYGGGGHDVIFVDGEDNSVVTGSEHSIVMVDGSASIFLGGGALIGIEAGSHVSISGFQPYSSSLFIMGLEYDEYGGLIYDIEQTSDGLWLEFGESSILLSGYAGDVADVFASIFNEFEPEEQDEVLDSVLGELTREQVVQFKSFMSTFSEGSDLIHVVQSLPEPQNGYGKRVEYSDSDETDSPIPWVPSGQQTQPVPVNSDDDETQDGSGTGFSPSRPDQPCFVATACYGDRLHPDVVALRSFRDNVMAKSVVGRFLIDVYWVIGPALAKHVQHDSFSGQMFRFLLALPVKAVSHRGT
jgi:hypothetical protein